MSPYEDHTLTDAQSVVLTMTDAIFIGPRYLVEFSYLIVTTSGSGE